ncbi:hypothetical protein BY458DRAFT_448075, partial [Sporodiniella umbellata]
ISPLKRAEIFREEQDFGEAIYKRGRYWKVLIDKVSFQRRCFFIDEAGFSFCIVRNGT